MSKFNFQTMEYEENRGRPKKRGPKKSGKVTTRDKHVAGRTRGAGVKASEKKANVAAFIAAGMDKDKALTMAGYSARSTHVLKEAVVTEAVQQMRERLQKTKGYTFEDSADFYKGISENVEEKADTRMKARRSMDSLLGYDATKKIEVSETRELSLAVELLSRLPVGMSDLAKLAADAEVVDDLEILEGAKVDGHIELAPVGG
jgi:hypothetical protein